MSDILWDATDGVATITRRRHPAPARSATATTATTAITPFGRLAVAAAASSPALHHRR